MGHGTGHAPYVLALAFLVGGPALRADARPTVTASSVYDTAYRSEYAVDGDPDTRWASRQSGGGPEWLQIDLGRAMPIENIVIRWEAAYATEYRIEISDDAKRWKTIHHKKNGKGGRELLDGLAGKGRYVRIYCVKHGRHALFSIWEVEFPNSEAARALKDARRKAEEAGRAAAADARKGPAERLLGHGVSEIVFAARENGVDGHWYANFAYYAPDEKRKCYRKAGRLCKLDVRTGKVTALVDDPEGSVRDPAVHYDAKKVLFSWRKRGTGQFHLYEVGIDGGSPRQLTDGIYDDIEPTYLPDGGIMFISGRCKRWVNCWLTQVGVLYRCDADGGNVRQISANIEHDNTPWVLPDGRVLYQRWEYVDRSQVHYHHLWTTNPDGTGQMIYFGNLHAGSVFIDAKPVPGTDSVVLINSPGHGANEHRGRVAIVSAKVGPDERRSMRNISGNGFRDPYALSEDAIIAARGRQMVLMNSRGKMANIYSLPREFGRAELHEPRPVIKRRRERVIPSRVNQGESTGRLVLADVYEGRNMKGVKKGEIKKLLVLETLPKPINYTGGMDPISYGGTFTLERVLGTVPVEPDGSAYMELPANRPLFFVALDENDMSVKRMQSFMTVMPGETTSCVGCHEQRTQTPVNMGAGTLEALRRPPSRIEPIAGVPDVLDFPRDVQPLLDRHCVRCHGYERPSGAKKDAPGPYAGRVILTGDRGPMFSHSYFELTLRRQFVDGRNDPKSNLPPRSIGTSASPLMRKLAGKHHGVKLASKEIDVFRYWIETGAAYPGTYAALGSGMIGGYAQNRQVGTDRKWPETKAARAVIDSRCASCHKGHRTLPKSLCDELRISFWRMNLNDKRLPLSRHRVFNLSRPDKSLMLLAPLAKDAGGYGRCRTGGVEGSGMVLLNKNDPGYRALRALCAAGKRRLEEITRFDMPTFRPPAPYVREMKRYGVLPRDHDMKSRIDVYKTDREYWKSLWYRPTGRTGRRLTDRAKGL